MAQAAEMLTVPTCFHGNDTKSLLLMASALGLKDKYTHGHAQRVATYAKRLAIIAGLPMKEAMQVTMGGMLHDLGKLALSDQIFSHQDSSLTEELLREVRNHPLIGAALVDRAKCSRVIYDAVLYHHERIDGRGYPFGIKGDAIPLSAKIVSIADCFDAITTDRPYQKHKSCEEAIAMLDAESGKSLSRVLVSLFIHDIRCNGMIC